MKKIFMSMTIVAAMFAAASCGNSSESADKPAAEGTECCGECTKAEGTECCGECTEGKECCGKCEEGTCCEDKACCPETECAETECPDCPAETSEAPAAE